MLETAKKGFEAYSTKFNKATYQFSSKENPETFDIVDGKLYLFFNGPFNGKMLNTLSPWNAKTTELLKKGHSNWKK